MSYRLIFPCLLVLTLSTPSVPARQPNVVIIVGDDHQNDVYGAYGNPRARTPNLDKLAADGIRFDRAYCNSPMCTPSRQSLLTGRYPHAVGVTLLRHVLSDSAYTLADRLREVGYRTGAFGKMHFNSNALHGFEVHRTPAEFHRLDRRRTHRPLPAGVEVFPAWRPHKDPARIWLNGTYLPTGCYDEEMPDTWYARQAIAFMREHRDEPFFVQIGFHQPHSPFRFPVEFRGLYDPRTFPVPSIGPEDVPQMPRQFVPLTYDDKQGIIASYYTATAYLDVNVGRVLQAIDELHLREQTLVVYLGDNGYHLGQHGRFEKHTLYERCVRVPLVMRFPGRIPAGTSTDALVEFVDVVPTVLDYLGVPFDPDAPAPRDLHGHSLRPLIEGRVEKVRDIVFSEYQQTQVVMARTRTHKLIYRTAHDEQRDWIGYEPVLPPAGRGIFLYDLDNDPEELHNVAARPENKPIVEHLLDALADWYRRVPPLGSPPPAGLTGEAFLDWAVAPRNP